MSEPEDWALNILKKNQREWIDNLLLIIHDLLNKELQQLKKGIKSKGSSKMIKPVIKRLSLIESLYEIQKEMDTRNDLFDVSKQDDEKYHLMKLSISLNHQN